MAAVSKGSRKANPLLTKNGRPRLKLLNPTQLVALSEKSQRPKDKDKIRNRLLSLGFEDFKMSAM
jgi:hypothetical protein